MLLSVKIIIGLVILAFIVFVYILAFALCKVAGDADRDMERIYEQRQ